MQSNEYQRRTTMKHVKALSKVGVPAYAAKPVKAKPVKLKSSD